MSSNSPQHNQQNPNYKASFSNEQIHDQSNKNMRNDEARKSLTEEQIIQQEHEDDQDLRELKGKLKQLASQKPPDNKDDLIQHLMERLNQAEIAIGACEEVISHERVSRKEISKELKSKNLELREIVNKEKRRLQDKVHDELEKTLAQALKEKMHAEKELKGAQIAMTERNSLVEELDGMYLHIRDEHRHNLKLTHDQQKIIEHLEDELQLTKQDRDRLQHLADDRISIIQKLNQDLDEAYAVISKLEEARIVLNRLLGQNGVLTERERQKFLRGGNINNEILPPNDIQGGGSFKRQGTHEKKNSSQGQANIPPTIGNTTSNKMLTQNNQYFYGDTQKGKKANPYGGGGAPLMDDANEDDFWYQTPKGGAGNNEGGHPGGDYQGFVNNANVSSGLGGPRANSRRGGAGQGGKF